MKKVVYWLTLFLLFSHGAFAAPNSVNQRNNSARSVSCNDIKGQKYLDVQFTVVGKPGTYQEVYVKTNSGDIPQVLWYTEDFKDDEKYIFNESSLKESVEYKVRFVNESNNGNNPSIARYYRKNVSAGNQHWQLIEEKNTKLKSGALEIISEGNITGLTCNESDDIPELPPIELDICPYVPSAVQTNNYFDGIPSGVLNINSKNTNTIYVSGTEPKLSFANVIQSTSGNCDIGGQKWDCIAEPKLTYSDFPPELEDYDTSDDSIYEDFICPQNDRSCELKPGKYRNVSLNMNSTLNLHSGSYYFNEINFNGQDGIIAVEGNKAAEVHYKKINFATSGKFTINSGGDVDNFLLVGHGVESGINITNNDSEIYGHIYVDPVAINGFTLSGENVKIHGGVSASLVNVGGNGKHHIGQYHSGECSSNSVEEDDYELSMSPSTQLALMCGSDMPTFEIVTKSGSDFVSTPVNISIPNANVGFTLNATTGSGNVCSISSSSDICSLTSDSNGKLVLTVAANSNNAAIAAHSYNLRASLAEDSDQSQTASFSFVPYKIDVKPHSESSWNNQVIPAIANKSVNIDARVLACPSGQSSAPVVLNYNKTLNNSALSVTLNEPATGSGNVSVNNMQFVDGQTGSGGVAVTFDESGEASVVIKDAGFSCSNFQELVDPDTGKCPIEGEILQGTFSVKARPWKFAVCALDSQGNNTAADGNSDDKDSVGYVAAGDAFSVRVAPLKYGSSECSDLEQLTQNYFLSDAAVELTHELDTPKKGIKGSLTGTLPRQVTLSDKNTNGYVFSDLKYDEVGSIQLAATETGAFYSPIEVDGETGISGESNIGRFYPHHFKLDSNRWSAVDGQNEINYMGQPFALAEVYIAPYAKGANTAVSNYHLFSDALVAKFDVADDVDIDNRLILDTELGTWHENASASQWSLNDVDAYVSKLISPNGPFNTGDVSSEPSKFGLTISGTDPVQFDSEDGEVLVTQELANQPPVRFGRIQLDDVGGSQGATLTVPLRVQYWNGERFVQNTDDNATAVEAELEKQELLWSRNGSNCDVELSGNSTVVVGVMRDLIAKQLATPCTETGRQQSQLWLELDSTANPLSWLKYDWNNDGSEENPSSVVTFGIHRGNDRVIYRGEPGLTRL